MAQDYFEMLLEAHGMTEQEWIRRYDTPSAQVQATPPVQASGPMSATDTPTEATGRDVRGFSALVIQDTQEAMNALRGAGYACFATPKGDLTARIVERKKGYERDEQKRMFGVYMIGFLHKSDQHRACALKLLRDGWRPKREPQTELALNDKQGG